MSNWFECTMIFTLWSGRFDRELTDIFAIQDEIALGIVNNLRLKLGGGRRRYETSLEAYDLYLRARAMPNQRGHAWAMEAADIYQQVIAKDARFAPGVCRSRRGVRGEFRSRLSG